MKIADKVEMLEVAAAATGRPIPVYPTLFYDERSVVLADTGFPGQLPMLKAEVERVVGSLDKIDRVIATHQDVDHIGNIPGLLGSVKKKIEVLCGTDDKPYIEGEKKMIKGDPSPRNKFLATLPEERRRQFLEIMANPPKAKVDRTLADGEALPDCGGILVIGTPGHTPGHISLYHELSRTLVAGDALRLIGGELVGPAPENAADLDQALKSVKKLLNYDIATVICYHGGVFRGDVRKILSGITAGI
ncbi:MAG TPA: MBL fold metallo-hydrolase [Candidatus Omnitrophota bacterium]|nr:MBL fold metallo-hydrolase [Candidatus Omnitrophota bacterium]